jgi:hypothetical protein
MLSQAAMPAPAATAAASTSQTITPAILPRQPGVGSDDDLRAAPRTGDIDSAAMLGVGEWRCRRDAVRTRVMRWPAEALTALEHVVERAGQLSVLREPQLELFGDLTCPVVGRSAR